MPVDNRNIIWTDLPDEPYDPELAAEDDWDEDEDDDFLDEDEDDDAFPSEDDEEPPGRDYLERLDEERRNNENNYRPFTPMSQVPPPLNFGGNQTTWPPRPTFQPQQQSRIWSNPFPQSNQPTYSPRQDQRNYTQRNEERIDRRKKILFVDLLDILIESESAFNSDPNNFNPNNNYKRIGVMPRGLYDIRLKLEVWSKLAAYSPDYIFCLTNQPGMSKERLEAWNVMVKYVMHSLAEYVRLPYENCKCLTKFGFSREDPNVKPRLGLMKTALKSVPKSFRYTRDDLVVIGSNSGYSNQGDQDRIMAQLAKVDYVDVWDLLVSYN